MAYLLIKSFSGVILNFTENVQVRMNIRGTYSVFPMVIMSKKQRKNWLKSKRGINRFVNTF